MAVWPSTVPVSRENFSESTPNRILRSNMDVGPAKVRRRSSVSVREAKIKLVLTDDQLTTFDTFFNTNDVLSFSFTNPRTGATETARFTEAPSFTLDQTLWNVNVSLEFLP